MFSSLITVFKIDLQSVVPPSTLTTHARADERAAGLETVLEAVFELLCI